jgi:hypothetical protein
MLAFVAALALSAYRWCVVAVRSSSVALASSSAFDTMSGNVGIEVGSCLPFVRPLAGCARELVHMWARCRVLSVAVLHRSSLIVPFNVEESHASCRSTFHLPPSIPYSIGAM